jgi:hypothetical protein
VAVQLEECLTDLVSLKDAAVARVSVLHDQALSLIQAVERVTAETTANENVEELAFAFLKYLRHWHQLPPPQQTVENLEWMEGAHRGSKQSTLGHTTLKGSTWGGLLR